MAFTSSHNSLFVAALRKDQWLSGNGSLVCPDTDILSF